MNETNPPATRSVEIPDEAVEAAERAYETFGAGMRDALLAALPYLAPAPPFDVIIDAIAARATAPVDRQALVRAIADELDSEGIVSYGLTPKLVDAVAALLAGEQEQADG